MRKVDVTALVAGTACIGTLVGLGYLVYHEIKEARKLREYISDQIADRSVAVVIDRCSITNKLIESPSDKAFVENYLKNLVVAIKNAGSRARADELLEQFDIYASNLRIEEYCKTYIELMKLRENQRMIAEQHQVALQQSEKLAEAIKYVGTSIYASK